MPTYQLKCTECGEVFKSFHKMSEDHPPCPACSSKAEVYMTEPPMFHLSGENWASKQIKEERKLLNAIK